MRGVEVSGSGMEKWRWMQGCYRAMGAAGSGVFCLLSGFLMASCLVADH